MYSGDDVDCDDGDVYEYDGHVDGDDDDDDGHDDVLIWQR